jgi:hypothetical protein
MHEEIRNAYKMLVKKPEGRRPLGKLCIGGTIVLEWISEK